MIQVSRKRHEQLKERDEKLPPDEKLVLDEAARNRLNQEKRILRTVKGPDDRRRGVPTAMDTRTPEEKGHSGPGSQTDLRIPLLAIQGRYDAKTFADFEAWARKTDLGDGRTVWGWLSREGAEAATTVAGGGATGVASGTAGATVAGVEKALLDGMVSEKGGTPVSTEQLAAAVAEVPDHPVSRDLRIWSEDAALFAEMKKGEGKLQREWRERMDRILLRIQPVGMEGRSLYRGFRDRSALDRIRRDKVYGVTSVGDSFSGNLDVATGDYLTEGGFLVEVRNPRNPRRMAEVFAATGGKAASENESIYPRGTRLLLLEEKTKTVEIDGKSAEVPYLVMEEDR